MSLYEVERLVTGMLQTLAASGHILFLNKYNGPTTLYFLLACNEVKLYSCLNNI
jgi:hypothetical protein